jgi:hypothetical protein
MPRLGTSKNVTMIPVINEISMIPVINEISPKGE